jgi:hypothetical protein
MAQRILAKIVWIGLFGILCLYFSGQIFGRYQVGGTYGYYAQRFHMWIESGLPQFIESARQGLGI